MTIAQNKPFTSLVALITLFTAFVTTTLYAARLAPAVPPNLVTSQPKPMILLNMSKDHQLSYRAYDEFTDLDGDGVAEKTYSHSFKYYGYFDPFKCYDYSGTSSFFAPTSNTTDKYCSGNWSGNFLNWATMSKMDIMRKVLYGGMRSTDSTTSGTVLERAYLPTDAHSFAKYYNGADLNKLTPFTSSTGLTICNTTLGASSGANRYSHTNTNPPLMRVAGGDHQLWNANERWQCYWEGDISLHKGNGNNAAITGLNSSKNNPSRSTHGLTTGGSGPDFTVRVKVCASGLIGTETCKLYPAGNYQPVGLMHEYGEDNQAEYALVTGSFNKNVSGGVLRSNMGTFRDEVNWDTNGTFKSVQKIVYTINKLRIYGYDYNDGTYIGADNCSYQLSGLSDGSCTTWGNPMGEMFLESLRYLGGLSSSSAYDFTNSGSKDASLGLPKPVWVDPFLRGGAAERSAIEDAFGVAQCRPVNAIHFNSSVTSYDHDQWSQASGLPGSPSISTTIDLIGSGENIHGGSWFVGENGTTNNKQCTAKTVSNLSAVKGLCSDAPAYKGSYSLAGVAYWARTNKFRTDITDGGVNTAFKVKSYSVAMSPGKPRIVVKHPTNGKTIVIQPSYVLTNNGAVVGSGTLVDFRVVSQDATSGKFLVIWEDSEQGGDYDQDASGILRYEISGDTVHVYSSTFADATVKPQGFGYTISGSDKDGVHFHSGILDFNYNDLTNLTVTRPDGTAHPNVNATGGCLNCRINQGESRATYNFSGASGGELKDPLWYAAKWGGFTGTGTSPATAAVWDVKKLDGTAGADGIPDNYFLAIRPDELEASLRSAFQAIVASTNSAPAVSTSQLQVGGLKFQGKFEPNDGHGEFAAFKVLSDGSFSAAAEWLAHTKLTTTSPSARQIITNEGQTGVAFNWSALTAATHTTAFGGTDAAAQARLAWLRGNTANDGIGLGFRKRNAGSILGPVISSNPAVSRPPRANLYGSKFPGYGTYVTNNKTRRSLVWVGAGDGMLHAFDASASASTGGAPVFSYVPQPLHQHLTEWVDPTQPNIQSFMDGSPFVADVLIDPTNTASWATYLFSALGRGGKGMFALDVTQSTSGLTEANAATVFKWQFTDVSGQGDSSGDLGFVLAEAGMNNRISDQPGMVAKMNNGKFAALLPNGYYSNNGSAALYILFANGPGSAGWVEGTHYRKLVAASGPGNGLSQPTWVDTSGDGVADFIYAGDLKGNLWKFDVRCSDPTKWRVAYSGAANDAVDCTAPSGTPKALFTATDVNGVALPITAAPDYRFHPSGGQLVTFATGRTVVETDFPDTTGRVHSIFGVWDNPIFATQNSTELAASLPRQRSDLASRTFTRITTAGDFKGKGYVSGSAFTWTSSDNSHKKGWAVSFPATSEVSVSNPLTLQGLIGFVSIVPSAGGGNCGGGPDAYLTLLDPLTGLLKVNLLGMYTDPVTNAEIPIGSIPVEDQKVIAVRDATKTECAAGTKGCSVIIGDKTRKDIQSVNTKARLSWNEIPGFKTRPTPP